MPPATGVLPPESPVAAPRGVTESPSSRLTASGGLAALPVLREDGHLGKPLGLRGGVVPVDEEVFSLVVDVSGSDLLPEVIDDGFVSMAHPSDVWKKSAFASQVYSDKGSRCQDEIAAGKSG